MLYKARNRQGFVYVKLDMDVFAERAALQAAPARLSLRDKLRDLLHRRFFAAVDLFSAESREGVALALLRFPEIRAKTIEVTNGLDLASVQASTPLVPFEQKEDLIITVGRLGTYQKNNEVFLDALRNIALGRWKVAFIGPFSSEFETSFNTLLLDRPDLAGTVTLVGNVRDRKQLMQWYNRAKAFVLTSRFEGFPLIFGEAQSFGNYMISTDVSSIREILVDGRYGDVIDAAGGKPLDVLLQNFIDRSMYTKERADELVAYASKKYEWRTILRAVDENIRAGNHV
jgi:glycosyltransferase involved in cell wall biosynthesis